MTNPAGAAAIAAEARRIADEFNTRYGGTYLTVCHHIDDSITVGELRTLATTHPGPYLAASVFRQIRGRRPTRGETIAVGRLLSALGIARKKDGAATLWQLDAAAAQRLS